ncbi:MAG: hypothetical protein QM706_04335 [Nitrospira sp.]
MTIFIIIGSITVIVMVWILTAAEESIIHGYPSIRETSRRILQKQEGTHVEAHRAVQTASLEPYTSSRALL